MKGVDDEAAFMISMKSPDAPWFCSALYAFQQGDRQQAGRQRGWAGCQAREAAEDPLGQGEVPPLNVVSRATPSILTTAIAATTTAARPFSGLPPPPPPSTCQGFQGLPKRLRISCGGRKRQWPLIKVQRM